MNFQLLEKHNDEKIQDAFLDFFLKSKPYDFCSLPSRSARVMQIKKYYEFLISRKIVYFAEDHRGLRFFIAFFELNGEIYVDFVFGPPFKLAKDFKLFREFYRKEKNENFKFYTKIHRKHKLKNFLASIKGRDPDAIFSIDNEEICVSWIA